MTTRIRRRYVARGEDGRLVLQGVVSLSNRAPAFWSQVDKSGDCWIWEGKRNPRHPYGQFYVGWDGERYVEMRAHRAAWSLANAQPVPEGMSVMHSCDNPICVNPDHLSLGTHTDNVRDMWAKGRARNRMVGMTHCQRGHEFTPENTTVSGGKRKCRACCNARERRQREERRQSRNASFLPPRE